MPQKKKKKSVRRIKKVKKKQHNHHAFLLTLVILLVGITLFVSGYEFFSAFRQNVLITAEKITHKKIARIPIPTPIPPTPTPSIFPTPTEAPLIGFCLHVPVLFYHHIQPWSQAKQKGQTALSVDSAIFDQQMAYLVSNGYITLSADALINALLTKTQLPSKSVVVTLDDGYKDAFEYAFPVFQKYGITGNVMIPTGLLEGSDYLSWSQLEQMAGSGRIYVTNHTWSHYALGGKTTEEKIKFEISSAAQAFQKHIGQKVDIFTYPYGSFSNLAISLLKESGFRGAFTTLPGTYQCDSFIMTLHRTRVGNSPLSFYGL